MGLNGSSPHIEYVEVKGLRLRVASFGSGPPLFLITGLGASIKMWGPTQDLLPGRTIIGFDAPGMGGSELSFPPLRIAGLADLVAALIDKLGYERLDVLGYSLGGGIAQELAKRHPERVERLILCGTGVGLGGMPPRNLLIPAILSTPYRFYSPRHMRAVMPFLAGGRTSRDKDILEAQLEVRQANPPSWLGYLMQVWAASGWSSLPWVHRLNHRTLVLAGDDDPIIPVVNARLLASRLPNSRLHVLPGAGHLFLVDEPESAIPVIQDFLGEPAETVG
jgi:poly(3-hydroxyoctanoate) depolymerase